MRIEEIFRAEHGRILATLIRLLGDIDVAEEALQEAFAAGLEQWPVAGMPANPVSWLVSTGRLKAAMVVVYLVFNEGYTASFGERLVRNELCEQAIRLGRMLVELLPIHAEPKGLLALMLLHDSRRETRLDGSSDLVLLEDQDRTRWDRAQIDEGTALVEDALSEGGQPPGPYALQAAIAALHAQAATAAATDWEQIAALYGVLARVHPTPVVELNRAVAVAMSSGNERGLALLDALDRDGGLAGYHLLPAARAELLRRLGRHAEAALSYRQALGLVGNDAERRHLEKRLREVTS